jgi:biotin transport system substrate-specific component
MSQYDVVGCTTVPLSISHRLTALWPAHIPTALRTGLLIGGGIALLLLSAKIKVPFYPVPMTLQTLSVGLLAAALGPRHAVGAVVGYLLLGLMGIPVFTNTPPSPAGLIYFTGPTGGYLAGFVVAAALVGTLCQRGWDRSFSRLWCAMLLGDAAIIGLGVAWLAFGNPGLGLDKALAVGLYPFLLGALLKQVLTATLIRQASRVLGL